MILTPKNIADEIRKLHDEIILSAKTTLIQAIRVGELLSEAKSSLKHGEWLPWLKDSVPFSERTASRYMSCWERREEISNQTAVSDLNDAYELLTVPKKPAKEPQADPPRNTPTAPPPSKLPPPAQNKQSKPTDSPAQSKHPKSISPPPPKKIDFQTDNTGFRIPDNLLAMWARRDEPQELMTYVSSIRSKLRKIQDSNDTLFARLDYTSALSHLDQIYADIKYTKPHCVCPSCVGTDSANCGLCKGIGLISEFIWDRSVSKETKGIRERVVSEY